MIEEKTSVEKEKNAGFEAFSPFSTMFSKAILHNYRHSGGSFHKQLILYFTIQTFNGCNQTAFKNIVREGENVGKAYFPFPTMFSVLSFPNYSISNSSSADALESDDSKILFLCTGLTHNFGPIQIDGIYVQQNKCISHNEFLP